MGADLSTGRHSMRHPLDWYVEEQWCTEQLFHAAGLEFELECGTAIWDPCCGYGNIGVALEAWAPDLRIICSDVVDNLRRADFLREPEFFSADFLELEVAPAPCTIVMNPPYSYQKGILEAFVRHALKLASGRVFALVPNKWLASQRRYQLFAADHPPELVLHLTQRPSMPPGDMIEAMGDRAFRNGKIDYCWICWDATLRTAPGETRTAWLPPLGLAPMATIPAFTNKTGEIG